MDARQILGHPIDLDKVDVSEVLRCIRNEEDVNLTGAVARDGAADRLKRWLPGLYAVREFAPAITELELNTMAYELLLCCTVLKGGTPLEEGDEQLMQDTIRVACNFKMRRHRELLGQLQVLGADERAAADLGRPSSAHPLLYRWLLLRHTSPTRETHESYLGWCRRQLVFLLVSLLLYLRAYPDRGWRLEGIQHELPAEEVQKHLIASCQRPLRELSSIDTENFYSTERYDAAMNDLAPHMDALFQQLQSGASASTGLPVAAPFSLVLYEVLLRVVLVGDELAEDGDDGKHPEADALVSLYSRCCWAALGLRSFEHGLAMASVGYERLITRGVKQTEDGEIERGSGDPRLGLLRSLVTELEGVDAPNLLVRVEEDVPTGIRWQSSSIGATGSWLVDQVSDDSPVGVQLRQVGVAGRGLTLLQVNGEAVVGKPWDEVLQAINADGRSKRTPLELAFKPPYALHSDESSGLGQGMICGIPISLPCTGVDLAAARSFASELLGPIYDSCREELSHSCESFDIDTGTASSAGESQAVVQAMAALVASASRIRGEDPQEAEGRAALIISASLHAYCASVADVPVLEEGDMDAVKSLVDRLQLFVTVGGFAAFANACLPTTQHCMSNRKGRGVQEAYFSLGLLVKDWVDAALFNSIAEESDAAITPASLEMIKSLILLEEALGQVWKQEVSDTERIPPAFNGKTITDLVQPPIAKWIEHRIGDWQEQMHRLLRFEKWEQTGDNPHSRSVNDLMEMLSVPMMMFDSSGLSVAASEEHRGMFVQAVAETVQSYVQQVATARDSDGCNGFRLPTLPQASQPLNQHLTRRSATKQHIEARVGQQEFAAAEEDGSSRLRETSLTSLAMRLNTLEVLGKVVEQHLVEFFKQHQQAVLGNAVMTSITQAISSLSDFIGAKTMWLGNGFLLQGLYRTNSEAINRCNKDIDARGGKKKVEDDTEITCIPPESVISAGRSDVLDDISTQLNELDELVLPSLQSVLMAAIFTKFLQIYIHVIINFDFERIFTMADNEIFAKDLVRSVTSLLVLP